MVKITDKEQAKFLMVNPLVVTGELENSASNAWIVSVALGGLGIRPKSPQSHFQIELGGKHATEPSTDYLPDCSGIQSAGPRIRLKHYNM
jgi:hypothetical protein